MNKISLNIVVNKTRSVTVEGREFLVLEAMATYGDSAMNGKLYPTNVVKRKAASLKDKPAPLSHPTRGGTPVSAKDYFTKGAHDIGAIVYDSYMNGDKNIAQIYVDKEFAERTPDGKRLIETAQSGGEIGVSTGLIPTKTRKESGKDVFGAEYDEVIEDYEYDHLALLLDERPAGEHAGTKVIYNSETNDSLLVLNHDGGQPSDNTTGDNPMKHELDLSPLSQEQRSKITGLTVNELYNFIVAEPKAPTLDEAKKIVANSGLLVNSKDDGVFITNEEAEILANAKEAEQERKSEMIEHIVANSDFTADMLNDKPENELVILSNAIAPTQDYSMQDTITTNAASGDGKFELLPGA